MIDLKELRRIALAATPGQWVSWPTGMDRADMRDIQGVLHSHNHTPYVGKNNADHICAFSPATALALLDELERCREALSSQVITEEVI